jgi:hypothetical protein
MWFFFAVFVVAFVVAYATMPKPQSKRAAGLDEFQAPTAEDGREIPVLFGTRDLNGPNVVWYGDLKVRPIKSKGGK